MATVCWQSRTLYAVQLGYDRLLVREFVEASYRALYNSPLTPRNLEAK